MFSLLDFGAKVFKLLLMLCAYFAVHIFFIVITVLLAVFLHRTGLFPVYVNALIAIIAICVMFPYIALLAVSEAKVNKVIGSLRAKNIKVNFSCLFGLFGFILFYNMQPMGGTMPALYYVQIITFVMYATLIAFYSLSLFGKFLNYADS